MQLVNATLDNIEEIQKLHKKYQIDTISEDDKKDGFITTNFSKEELSKLILEEQGLFVAKIDGKIVAYVMCASWQFWSAWPMFEYIIKDLPKLSFKGQKVTVDNSYQYGPVCVDKSVRGSGVLEKIFEYARIQMNKKYPILITFINKINPRSYEAHTRKLGLEVIQEFTYNNNNYYELVYDTNKKLGK